MLFVMARDQRVRDNPGLAAAQGLALQRGLPLVVVFCLQPGTGRRAREHYAFMLDGLREVEKGLQALSIPFMLLTGNPRQRVRDLIGSLKPAALFFDFSPLRGPLALHAAIAKEADCAVYETDCHNVVPAWVASDKQEYGARTLRTKLHRLLAEYLEADMPPLHPHPHAFKGDVPGFKVQETAIEALLQAIPSNGTDISRFRSGEKAAEAALQAFLDKRLRGFAAARNDPARDGQSELSPYMHFGQLSGTHVVRSVEERAAGDLALSQDADALIEQLVVRKELSDNYCLYNPRYDSLDGAPEWARRTLQEHASDERPVIYGRERLEQAQTHDEAWNASQRELVRSGKMHGYMRMYWAKKVLEWSASPQEALETLIYLNDFYSIDGGDPNGYAGILWSVAGLHDRPWGTRPVFGSVRSMVYDGLKRKFDIAAYIDRWPA